MVANFLCVKNLPRHALRFFWNFHFLMMVQGELQKVMFNESTFKIKFEKQDHQVQTLCYSPSSCNCKIHWAPPATRSKESRFLPFGS